MEQTKRKRHKHNYENVMDLASSSIGRDMQILMCDECQNVVVHYKEINKKITVKKPKVR